MRLNRLFLTRYGKFTDRVLDFGPPPAGAPDLHVIYGPNEAGKSTASSAMMDLMFGIGAQSPYGFLHPYATMRIGAVLDLDDGPRTFARIKRPQNSLLDGEDRPIPESALRAGLGGMDRAAYSTMFMLDDETLEKGGESILASKGDLGELLFSASAGLADLGRRLGVLREEANAFYRYYGRSGRLAELKAQIATLKEERDGLDTLAADHARLVAARDDATRRYKDAIAERTRMQLRLAAITRELDALPRLAALRGLRAELGALPQAPEPPAGWAEDLPGLRADDADLRTRAALVSQEVIRLSTQRDAAEPDPAALALAPRLPRLADLRARHVTAEKDIPKLEQGLQEREAALAGLLRRMEREGEADPSALLLGASAIGRLRELMESRSGVEAALTSARLEEERAAAVVETARMGDEAADPQALAAREAALAALAAELTALRGGDHGTRCRLAGQAVASAEAALDDRLAMLAPWIGTADELLALRCPTPAAIAHRKAALEERRAAVARHRDEAERTMAEAARLTAEGQGIANAVASMGVPGDAMAENLRTRRDEAWATHRRTLSAATANAFEIALKADDKAVAVRAAYAGDLARLHQVTTALNIAEADARSARTLEARARGELQTLENEVAAAIRIMAPSLAGSMTLADLEDWLARRERALEARAALQAAAREHTAVEADAGAARARLAAALAGLRPADAEAGLDALIAAAQGLLDHEAGARVRREARAAAERDLENRRRAVSAAMSAVAAWDAAWAKACGACWLGAKETPALATVRECLSALSDLGPVLEAREGLVHRIAAMVRDQGAFREEVESLAAALSMDAAERPAPELADAVEARVREAEVQARRRAEAVAALEAAEADAAALTARLDAHEARKAVMTGFFGVADLDAVAARLAEGARRVRLVREVTGLESEIRTALGAADIIEAERRLDTADRASMEVERLDLAARSEDQDRHCHALFAEKTRGEDAIAAIGGDAKAAQIAERRRTVLLEIEEGALTYLQLRAGTAAAESALAAYRERHRSAMMAKASEAFRTISRGAYSGLAAQPGKDGEVLIALGADGSSKAANELSKGTRFQLYLALRVAGYHEFTRARVPVPFIADDIMETFDDFRAEEAFRLFAGMAKEGQVIYFTHHRHLLDIARAVCPDARIHRLDADAGGAEVAIAV